MPNKNQLNRNLKLWKNTINTHWAYNEKNDLKEKKREDKWEKIQRESNREYHRQSHTKSR